MNRRHALKSILIGAGAALLGHALYLDLKAIAAQHLLRAAWEEGRARQRPVPPWPWADTAPIARLRVPAHDVDLIVLAGATGRSLAFGPGHMSATPLPGEPGVSVVSGHRDTHFRFLRDLRPGQSLGIERLDGTRRRYRVVDAAVVDARNAVLPAAGAHPLLVLVTCYPFVATVPGGPLRYLVLAEAVGE
ncbi:MAG: class GN sortase [Gammaproteobacteria bacterium]|nr:class GN sortase [Gammaproteobacteria bacterium]